MLYLCSLRDMKLLPDNVRKLFIARKPIVNMEKYNLQHITQLAPSTDILKRYKCGEMTWQEYVWHFRVEMLGKRRVLDFVYEQLQKEDIAFICYCNNKHCHRYLLGNYFCELGIEVQNVMK